MDLVEQMQSDPTAAQLQVKRLRARLDDLTDRGERWTEEGRKTSRALDLALVERAREGEAR